MRFIPGRLRIRAGDGFPPFDSRQAIRGCLDIRETARQALGRIFTVTRERVRQIEAKAVKKLQHPVRSRQLAGGDASEASVQVLESQWAAARPLSPAEEALTVHVDTTRPVDWDVLLPRTDGGVPVTSPAAPA